MNNKLIIFLFMVGLVFGYAAYEAKKLDSILSNDQYSLSNTVIKDLPSKLSFKDLETKKILNLEELTSSGNNLVVHFWATWCGPCEAEFPHLIELSKLLESRDDIKFILVAVNDDAIKIKKFLKGYIFSNNTILLTDDDDGFKKFGSYKLPETFVFNKQAGIVKKFTGQQAWTQKHIVDFFKAL